MRFILCLTFLYLCAPSLAQDSFRLRIENLKCIEYSYDQYVISYSQSWNSRIDVNNTFPQAPVNGLATIKMGSDDAFQLGFVPSKSATIKGTYQASLLNLGAFRFGIKDNPDAVRAKVRMSYTLDLTDGTTSYKLTLNIYSDVVDGDRRTHFVISDENHLIGPEPSADATDQSFLFPQSSIIQKVTFLTGFFRGSWDNLPLMAAVTNTPKLRTLREVRSASRRSSQQTRP